MHDDGWGSSSDFSLMCYLNVLATQNARGKSVLQKFIESLGTAIKIRKRTAGHGMDFQREMICSHSSQSRSFANVSAGGLLSENLDPQKAGSARLPHSLEQDGIAHPSTSLHTHHVQHEHKLHEAYQGNASKAANTITCNEAGQEGQVQEKIVVELDNDGELGETAFVRLRTSSLMAAQSNIDDSQDHTSPSTSQALYGSTLRSSTTARQCSSSTAGVFPGARIFWSAT
jgi:hypothetical protein